MPEKIYLHAIAAVNEETSILTGGYASWRSLKMEGELVANFLISETKRDFD